jgi:hypothetical protein
VPTLFADYDPKTAIFSPRKTYRYTLTREWAEGRCVVWMMLNPSTATEELDDPTIRRCIGFSKLWGYGRLIVLNLFGLRSTDPRGLARVADPVGPENDFYISESFNAASEIICAWGCWQHLKPSPLLSGRPAAVVKLIPRGTTAMCLGYRNDGAPRHPLMVPYSAPRVPFSL